MNFSILIAHFNNHPYFVDCYKSLQEQSDQEFEIIILDDASAEESFNFVQELVKNDEKVHIFRNESNKGVGYTKRRLIELCETELCGFLDPDDALEPSAVEKMKEAFSNPQTVAAYSQFYWCDENLQPLYIFKNTAKIPALSATFFNLHFEVAHFFTFRKTAYEKTSGINPELSSAEDQDLYLKLYEKGNFAFVPEPLYRYRTNSAGLSQAKDRKPELKENWNSVLKNTLHRRNIKTIKGRKVTEIKNLSEFLLKKENSLFRKILRKLK